MINNIFLPPSVLHVSHMPSRWRTGEAHAGFLFDVARVQAPASAVPLGQSRAYEEPLGGEKKESGGCSRLDSRKHDGRPAQ